ncbi:unnamed protein product [Rhizophagus irregularis]|nr:unnamed protein product [Rhizophagus irregularis]
MEREWLDSLNKLAKNEEIEEHEYHASLNKDVREKKIIYSNHLLESRRSKHKINIEEEMTTTPTDLDTKDEDVFNQPPSKRAKNDDPEKQRTPNYPPETSREISANQGHDDGNESVKKPDNSPIYEADETEEDYSDQSDTDAGFVDDDNDDDPDYVDSSESSSSAEYSPCEEVKVKKPARKLESDEETSSVSLTKRTRLNEDTTSDSVSVLNESANFDYGLRSYKEGIVIDAELALQETDEESVPASERLFNENVWKKWTLKSGAVVADLLDKFAHKKGHPLRPEAWRIVRCGYKIAKPKWCSSEDYSEIQRYTRRATISNRTETISRLQRQRSLESLGQSIEEIRLLNNIMKHHQKVFSEFSVMQQSDVSESDYGGYVIHPSLQVVIFGLEKSVHYHIGEIILSSVKSCRERRKRITSFEQKADGVFVVRLKKSIIEVGHLEMSGGYGHKDLPRSTWDGCCKLPIGNSYMLEEIGERFRGASTETFSKINVFSIHTYENWIELWRMHVPSCGVLQYERTHKTVVPICFEEERKCIFDFVIVLWDLRCWLLEVAEVIYKLQEEHNDSDTNVSNLSGTLPSHPFTPQKEKHKKGITATYANSDPGSSPIRSNIRF